MLNREGRNISTGQNQASETLDYLNSLVAAAIVRGCSVEKTAAAALAMVIVSAMRTVAGGAMFYIPSADKDERDAGIRREFCGRNIKEVCGKYGLSARQVYRIANRKRS